MWILKHFHSQSSSSLQNFSNDRLQWHINQKWNDYDCKKIQKICFLKNLGPSSKKERSSLGKVAFSTRNLGPSSKKIHCSPRKLYFSQRTFSYSIGNLLGTSIYFSCTQESYFLQATNLKNYLIVLWIFSSISFVRTNNKDKDWTLNLWVEGKILTNTSHVFFFETTM